MGGHEGGHGLVDGDGGGHRKGAAASHYGARRLRHAVAGSNTHRVLLAAAVTSKAHKTRRFVAKAASKRQNPHKSKVFVSKAAPDRRKAHKNRDSVSKVASKRQNPHKSKDFVSKAALNHLF